MLEQSYTAQPAGSPTSGAAGDKEQAGYWPLSKLKKCYTDYLFNKREEIDEQIDSRRYYHGSQWTEEQIKVMKKRKQPVMTFNRISRKIDGVIGLVEKLRQDPKAFARTPQHEAGAELATAALRYVLDEQEWKAKSPLVALDGAIDGIGGIEIEIEQGDQGDPEIGFEDIDIQSFFYDPRSYEPDFEDARYMGVGKWVDQDIAEGMFPDADFAKLTSDSELTNSTDRETRWFSSVGQQKRVRLVDIWYKHKGGWCWAIFTGSAVLMEGQSYLKDEKKKDLCKYIMFSGNVDQDGDRYSFVRNMKSAQDGINAKQSRLQHIIHSKRLIISQGAVDDVEKTRTEWARVDGVVVTNRAVSEGVKIDDQSFDFTGLTKLLEFNLAEIENFGPNPALIGQGIENKSGKAIQLLQQAGMAELGPYILSYRGWKVRVYRALWCAISQHWKAERWIRVTDDQSLTQYIQINGMGVDPQTGQPAIINAIGSLDVDIIIDEAPDAVTLQMQAFEVMQSLGPQFMMQYPDIVLELAPLDTATKKKITDKQQQAAQKAQPQQQLAMANEQAKAHQTEADAKLKEAQTAQVMMETHLSPLQTLMDGQGQPQQPGEYQLPPELQNMQAAADIAETHASTQHKQAQAFKTNQEAALAPQSMALDFVSAAADRAESTRAADEDRKIAARQRTQAQR
jgi:hypothetical protein